MDLQLNGKRVLVTGASKGIGLACAVAFAREGARPVLVARDAQGLAEAAGQVARQAGVQVDIIACDLAEPYAAARLADKTGGLDILVNNAGLQQDAAFTEMTLAQWNKVMGTNLTGMFLCSRLAVKEFLRCGLKPGGSRASGKIICMSSVHEVIPWAGHVNYAASKGGVKLFMQSLAQELAPKKIRVNSIGPGAIQTPINKAAWDTQQALDALLKLIPYGRIGVPEDIGKAAVWLASDDSDYVNGQTIFVDGGMTLYPEFADGG